MRATIFSAVAAVATLVGAAQAEVKLGSPFSDHMVLQRDMPVPVWGNAKPGEKITVTFQQQTKTTQAGENGDWSVSLDPLQAGGPEKLVVNDKTIDDVLIGEVWLGSGQSNMQTGANFYGSKDPVLQNNITQTYPKIRLLVSGRSWTVADPKTLVGFSAMLTSFAIPLQKELDVPVGVVVGAVGGTASCRWITKDAFAADPEIKKELETFVAANPPEVRQKTFEKRLAQWQEAVEKAKKENKREPLKPVQVEPGEASTGKIGDLYLQHIAPLTPIAVRGILWDQGEAGTGVDGVTQPTLMPALVKSWRETWKRPDMPFIFIQKPSGGGCAWDPSDPITSKANEFAPLPAQVPAAWADTPRLSYLKLLDIPHSAMVICTDLGPGVHPDNKSGYGARACKVALVTAYGKAGEIYGPLYASHKIEGAKVRVSFTHTGKGLAFKHGDKLQGFALAGADKVFHWADATIDEATSTVVLSSDKVAEPKGVLYGSASVCPWANLFNKDGLPAQNFRINP